MPWLSKKCLESFLEKIHVNVTLDDERPQFLNLDAMNLCRPKAVTTLYLQTGVSLSSRPWNDLWGWPRMAMSWP